MTRLRGRLALLLCAVAAAAGCSGSADTPPPQSETATELVVLEDDKRLQTVDNIVPVVATEAAVEPLVRALDAVSAEMTTEDLIALNRAVDVEGRSVDRVAEEYVQRTGLAGRVSGGTGTLVVGAANFTESQVVAAVYAKVLEAAGYLVQVQGVTNREVYGPALERGELTVFPEYVGTYTEYLNRKVNGPDAEPLASGDLQATVAALRRLAADRGLTVLEPSAAAAQNAFAVTRAFAEEHGLRTLSDLAGVEGELVLGGPPECPQRPFCQPGLEQVYGIEFDDFVALDAGGPLTKAALRQGRISVGLVFSSDGSLTPLRPTPAG